MCIRDRLYDARQRALKLAANYKAPEKITDIKLSGTGGKLALDMAVTDLQKSGKATPYDGVVSAHLAQVLTGGGADLTEKLTEDDLLKRSLTNT